MRDGPARLYVDRVFTLRGIGTVATGTLWSGTIAEGDTLRIAPRGGEVRVRSVQVHDTAVRARARVSASRSACRASSGSELHRGDALVAPGAFPISYRLDVELEELAAIDNGARVSVHHGTSRIAARVARVGDRTAQLRLEAPVVAARGDRVVLRGETTLGGATVLDPGPAAPARGGAARAARAGRSGVDRRGDRPRARSRSRRSPPAGLLSPAELEEGLAAVIQAGGWAFSQEWLDETSDVGRRAAAAARRRVAARAGARGRRASAGGAVGAGDPAAAAGRATRCDRLPARRRCVARGAGRGGGGARRELDASGLAAVKPDDPELARFLEAEGDLVRLGDGFVVSAAAYERARELVVAECGAAGEIVARPLPRPRGRRSP